VVFFCNFYDSNNYNSNNDLIINKLLYTIRRNDTKYRLFQKACVEAE